MLLKRHVLSCSLVILTMYGRMLSASEPSITVLENRVRYTIEQVQTFHQRSSSLGDTMPQVDQNMKDQKRRLYDGFASKMEVSAEYDHLPFPVVDAEHEWTQHASRVAHGLKLNTNYEVDRGRLNPVIYGSQAAVKNLYNNVRVVAWYRNRLAEDYSIAAENQGAVALARLIDEFLCELDNGLPQVNVRKTGRLNQAKDQKVQFSESKIWEILSSINRYFFYKLQICGNGNEYYAADFLLMDSMIRIAGLYGSKPPGSVISETHVDLIEGDPGWKGAAFDALHSWEMEVTNSHDNPQNVCSIQIPAREVPKPAPKKLFPTDVEDVREVGGQIFVKRQGRWEPWEK